jgi:XTP/dITP diphosphohydrolase
LRGFSGLRAASSAYRLHAVKRLILATNNPGKVREFRRLLDGCGYEVVTPREAGVQLDVDETGTTYAANATLKARAFAAAANCLALADDSGIEVDALDGGPGVYSARYGGPGLDDPGRTSLLLRDLGGTPLERRTARYRAVVAVAEPGAEAVLFEGVQEGRIAFTERGSEGFGYDPVFLVDALRTQAEIGAEEKDQISHRGKAMRLARAWLEARR